MEMTRVKKYEQKWLYHKTWTPDEMAKPQSLLQVLCKSQAHEEYVRAMGEWGTLAELEIVVHPYPSDHFVNKALHDFEEPEVQEQIAKRGRKAKAD